MIVLVNAMMLFISPKNKDWVIFSSALIGNEMIALVNVGVFILGYSLRQPVKIGKIKRGTFFCIAVIVCSGLISSIENSTTWNLIIYLVYLCVLAFTYKFSKLDLSSEKLVAIIKFFVTTEFICTLIIMVRINRIVPGDPFGGTIFNAHYFANWLVLSLFALINLSVKYDRNTLFQAVYKNIIYVFMMFFMIYMAEAKTVVVAVVISVILYILINPYKRSDRNDLFWLVIVAYIGFACILKILQLEPVKIFLSERSSVLRIYVYSYGWNYKFEYFYGTFFDSLKGIRGLTGYGLGQYGSRIANAFAYKTMWRADNIMNSIISSVFEARCIPEYARYISFYTSEFVKNIRGRSAVLSYPFSSFISLIAETGVVGVGLAAYWINKTFKNCNCKILIYYFLVVCAFDIFFDDYLCVLPLILYIACFMGFKEEPGRC